MKNMPNRMRDFRKLAIGYVRVSTPGQGEHGCGLDRQRVAIETFADTMGYTLIETYEEVASCVAEKSFHKREQLKAALDHVDREGADLIIWDWDRLSRYAGFESQVKKVLPSMERIVCVKRQNTLPEASRAGTIAHDELVARKIANATKKGMRKKRAQGVVFGNPAILTSVQPLGTAANSNNAQDLIRRIADVLRDLDDLYNLSYAELAKILNEKGIRTSHEKEWTASRARIPVKKARELLREEDAEELVSQPNFGMF